MAPLQKRALYGLLFGIIWIIAIVIAAAMPRDSLGTTIEAIRKREIDPYRAAEALLREPGDG